MLVFFVLSGSLDIQILNSQSPRRLCKSHRQVALRPLFKKAHNFEFPPPPQLNTTPRPHSNTKVFTTVDNEPLGDIARSDVKDVAENNNTKQLFTEVVPRRKVARLTTRFYTFPPYILLKRRQGTRQFYPTKFIK